VEQLQAHGALAPTEGGATLRQDASGQLGQRLKKSQFGFRFFSGKGEEKDRTMTQRNRLLTGPLLTSVILLASLSSAAAAESTRNIVVFDFEMMDSSAGAGIIQRDDRDKQYLEESTQVAKDYLAKTGTYKIVDLAPAAAEIAKAGELRSCNGCEAGIASKLGGQFAMTGVVNRISRTEYEMLIKVIDANTGAPVTVGYTGLRMGANYSWPRGTKWLMERRVLANLSGK
jgi:uncharacterized protein DUF2380